MSAGLHLHALPQDVPAADPASKREVFVVLRRVIRRWSPMATVVSVHSDEDHARQAMADFLTYEPNRSFGIFKLIYEEGHDL